ncbi:hypothetical protein [Actinophytocola gossypii]|uniref:Secreted protein n=1 Tax=Actinophytocola gossypii TaxID=2812003 RepID=A0ABT2JDY1_9PSEU|nr:hypothetical protein [Actinophytocola gossypii]MCT2586079.1 hypothetical protein [Actinophytocola gossypii]
MSIFRKSALLTAALATALLGVTAPVAAATDPPTLAGAWAPLNRCAVDDPAMLAADGVAVVAACLSSSSAGGSITIGETTLTTGANDLQAGVLNRGGDYTLVAPDGGAVVGDPVQVPGGLLGLMCPSDIPFISDICERVVGSPLNRVTATIEAAGTPTDFNLGAGLGVGEPIVTLPVKIRLDNPFLGSNCHIGSDDDPILLRPANLTRPTGGMVRFDADGTPNPTGEMGYISLSGADQGDSTFAVPGADGCGFLGLLNGAVNLQQGLPSPAGENSLTLTNATTNLGGFQIPRNFAPTQGEQLSTRWHAAITN